MTQPGLHLTLTSDPAEIAGARKAVEAFARETGFDDAAANDIGLCVNEALANVIRHAYENVRGKPIELSVEVKGEAFVIILRDWGNGRVPDIQKVKTPDPSVESAWKPGGLGLPCMKGLLDDLQFEKQPDGMRLRMTKMKR